MFKRFLAGLLAFLVFSVFAAVDANKGTSTDLDAVKGIGPALSAKIVEARKKGDFKDWADFIERVSGVGEKSAAKLSEAGLTVNGQSYKATASAAKADKKADSKVADKTDKKADDKADKKVADKTDSKADKKADKKPAKADAPAAAASK